MGNPQTNMLNAGAKSSNNHVSGRFAGMENGSVYQNSEHVSTLHSNVDMTTLNNNFMNNAQGSTDALPAVRNNKFVKQDVVVSDTKISNEKINPANDYMNDPRVRANLDAKKDVNQLIDTKTLMLLALIVMIFIFVLPFIYDVLN